MTDRTSNALQEQASATSPVYAQTLSSDAVLDALKMILIGAPLNDVLTSVALLIEAHTEGVVCSIFLLDEDAQHLRYAAAPKLSDEYRVATDGVRIGPQAGSCGAAAYLRQPVFIPDVLSHPHFANFKDLIVRTGLRAAWSSPIMSHDGKVLGTFGMYYREVRHPGPAEIQLIDHASRIAGIAIERDRSKSALTTAFEKIEKSEAELRQIVDIIPQAIIVLTADGRATYANRAAIEYTGLSLDEVRADDFRSRVFHPEEVQGLDEQRRQALSGAVPFENEQRARGTDGEYRWFLIRYNPLLDESGKVIRWYATGTDIEDRKRTESLRAAENWTLEMIADGASLEDILNHLCTSIDVQVTPSVTTVLLMDPDGQRLWPTAGPLVPREWISTISPVPVAMEAGLCGAAAFLKGRVVVTDVATDPNWPDQYRDLAIRNGIRAAWSEPILTKDNKVLGTFALYSRESRVPTDADLALIEGAARIALIAIERQRSQAELAEAHSQLKSERDRLRLLLDVQEALVANLDLPSLFKSIAANLRRVIGCDLIGLTLPQPDGTLRQRMDDYGDHGGPIKEGMLVPMHGSATGKAFRTRKLVYMDADRPDADIYGTPEGEEFYQLLLKVGVPSGYFLPLIHKDEVIAVMQLTKYTGATFKTQQAEFLTALAGQLAVAVANALEHDAVVASRDQLARERIYLREEIERSSMFEEIVGSSPALRRVLAQVSKVAPTDSTVLILGETGTGKELIARAIHNRSKRANRAFIRVNCAAIPSSLIASELFGHEKGSFTGALQRRLGRFESADGGTIFLDEIGELPLETQVALLRVLQEREFERVGGNHPISIDVRVLTATNKDLNAAVAEGTFRKDLFYRFNVFPIQVPALRERGDDICLLVEYLVDRYAKKAGKRIRSISKDTLNLLQTYDWPGNIRELQNVVERAVVLCDGDVFWVDPSWVTPASPKSATPTIPLAADLAEREKTMIENALREAEGLVSGPTGAAAKLGMPRQTLESKIRKLGINRHRFKAP
jgi:formate hydrogenlyase transcriptional activator